MTTGIEDRSSLRKSEWLSFLFFTLILLPAIAVAFVGAYGFVVWMSHEIYGPPTTTYELAEPPASDPVSGLPIVPPADGANE